MSASNRTECDFSIRYDRIAIGPSNRQSLLFPASNAFRVVFFSFSGHLDQLTYTIEYIHSGFIFLCLCGVVCSFAAHRMFMHRCCTCPFVCVLMCCVLRVSAHGKNLHVDMNRLTVCVNNFFSVKFRKEIASKGGPEGACVERKMHRIRFLFLLAMTQVE